MKKIITVTILLLVFLLIASESEAQKAKRFSADFSLGIPVTMFSVNSDLVGIYQAGLRYSLSKSWSVSGSATYNSFQAKTGNSSGVITGNYNSAADLIRYKNEFYGLHGYMHYNLNSLLGLNVPKNRIMPYLTLGAGLLFHKLNNYYVDGKNTQYNDFGNKPFRNYQLGLGLKYYLSPAIDIILASEYNYVETYFMDGVSADKKTDTYLNNRIGLSYKFGTSLDNNLIDWTHKNLPKDDSPLKDYAKWSTDLNLGLPYLFTPIGYSPTLMGGLGIRYSFNPLFSLQLAYNIGQFSGNHNIGSTITGSELNPNNVKEFSTTLNQVSLRGLLNLRHFGSEPIELRKWNYYGIIGIGYLFYNCDNTLANDKKISFSYNNGTQNITIGLQARKHLNIKWDFLTGIDFNYNESKYIDGAGDKNSLNHFIYVNAGISYKIANRNKRELIDWSYSKYNRIQGAKEIEIEKIPVIQSKPKETPKVEEIKPIEKPKLEEPKLEEPKIEQPKKEEPKIEQPKKEEPKVEQTKVEAPKVDQTKVVPTEAKKEEPKIEQPKLVIPERKKEETKVQIKEEPKVAKETPKLVTPSIAERSEEILPPPYRYNVIVACYGLSQAKSAFIFRDKMRLKGFEANVYKDAGNSRILKVATISTDDKATATQILRRAKKEIDPMSWLHLYNKQ